MLQSTPGEDGPMSELSIASPAFPGNGLIPRQYTCDGGDRYFFKLYALDAPLTLPPGATMAQVETAMGGHLLGKAETIGRYRRN